MNNTQQINALAVYYRDALLATQGWNHPSTIELLLRLAIRNGMDLVVPDEPMLNQARQRIAELELQNSQFRDAIEKAKQPSKTQTELAQKLKNAEDDFRALKERYEISLQNHQNEVSDLRQYLADVQDQLAAARMELKTTEGKLAAIPIDDERVSRAQKALDQVLGREAALKQELKSARKAAKQAFRVAKENEALKEIIETERTGQIATKEDL